MATGCRLKVKDFHQDGDEATITLHEKGDKRRTIGLHFAAAQAIAEYIEKAGLTQGPLFRAQAAPRSREKLADRPIGLGDDVPPAPGLPAPAPGSMRGGGRGEDGIGSRAVRLHAALAAGDDGDAAARRRRGHHQGEGPAGPPARDDDADLRQAADGASEGASHDVPI